MKTKRNLKKWKFSPDEKMKSFKPEVKKEASCEERSSLVWDRAADTLASMCVSERIGQGPTKRAFISTLRLYADEMEKTLV